MTTKKVEVKQVPNEEPIAAEVLAKAIIEIDAAMKKIATSGLKRSAIVALIKDRSGLTKHTIEIVLNNLDDLRRDWCTR